LAVLLNVNQSKKWAVDVPYKSCIRLYFSFRPSCLKVSPIETKIEPDGGLLPLRLSSNMKDGDHQSNVVWMICEKSAMEHEKIWQLFQIK